MPLPSPDAFAARHIGPSSSDVAAMLAELGVASLDQLVGETIPAAIRMPTSGSEPPPGLPAAATEVRSLAELRERANENEVFRSYLGQGFHGTHTPPVVLRNVLENPGWYTAYTPYQAEI